MISIQTSVSKGWLHNEGGFRFDERYYFDPLTAGSRIGPLIASSQTVSATTPDRRSRHGVRILHVERGLMVGLVVQKRWVE